MEVVVLTLHALAVLIIWVVVRFLPVKDVMLEQSVKRNIVQTVERRRIKLSQLVYVDL